MKKRMLLILMVNVCLIGNEAMENWLDVWERKGTIEEGVVPSFEELLAIDGYDTNTGKCSVESYSEYVRNVCELALIHKDDSIMEVGCGAGAFLYTLYQDGYDVTGVDYSQKLINISQLVMPNAHFERAEAASLPYPDESLDVVLSVGVFLYFPELDYAEKALSEIYRVLKPGGRVVITGLPNEELQELWFETIGEERALRMKSTPHLFYSKEWVQQTAEKAGFEATLFDHKQDGYGNATFRFNVSLVKSI